MSKDRKIVVTSVSVFIIIVIVLFLLYEYSGYKYINRYLSSIGNYDVEYRYGKKLDKIDISKCIFIKDRDIDFYNLRSYYDKELRTNSKRFIVDNTNGVVFISYKVQKPYVVYVQVMPEIDYEYMKSKLRDYNIE